MLDAKTGSSETFAGRIARGRSENRSSVLTDHPADPSWKGVQRKAINGVKKVIWIVSQAWSVAAMLLGQVSIQRRDRRCSGPVYRLVVIQF